MACLLANRKYGKNTQHGDIKSHQYIISFDPRDAADNGLTMEKAQALGTKKLIKFDRTLLMMLILDKRGQPYEQEI